MKIIIIITTCGILLKCQAQNLVVNGSFASPAVTNAIKWQFFPATNLWPWQTKETVFELWTNGIVDKIDIVTNAAYSAPGCFQNLEIQANAGTNTVWQTVPTIAGESYYFSFYHTPRAYFTSQLTVSVNSNVVASILENGSVLTNFAWNLFLTNFVANSNLTTLSFKDVNSAKPSNGTHIDGVVLEHIPRLVLQYTNFSTLNGHWFGVSNETYHLQYTTNLASTNWSDIGTSVTGNNTTNYFSDSTTNSTQKFYRVKIGP